MNNEHNTKEHNHSDHQHDHHAHDDVSGMDSVRTHVLEAIKDGEVTMRPRWHFVLKAVLAAAGALLIFFGTIYLMSFIIFVLYKTGIIYVPDFGLHGIMRFLFNLPWILILVAFIFAILLEILVQRYAFVYKKPLLYSLFGVVALVVAGSVIVAATPLHSQFLKNSRERHFPFFPGQLYLQFGFQRTSDVHRGVVESITDNGFYLKEDSDTGVDATSTSSIVSTSTDGLIQVSVTPQTRFPMGTDISIGDSVVVFGDESTSSPMIFQAYGVEKVMDDLEISTGMYPGVGTSSFPRPGPNDRVFYVHFSQ